MIWFQALFRENPRHFVIFKKISKKNLFSVIFFRKIRYFQKKSTLRDSFLSFNFVNSLPFHILSCPKYFFLYFITFSTISLHTFLILFLPEGFTIVERVLQITKNLLAYYIYDRARIGNVMKLLNLLFLGQQ